MSERKVAPMIGGHLGYTDTLMWFNMFKHLTSQTVSMSFFRYSYLRSSLSQCTGYSVLKKDHLLHGCLATSLEKPFLINVVHKL